MNLTILITYDILDSSGKLRVRERNMTVEDLSGDVGGDHAAGGDLASLTPPKTPVPSPTPSWKPWAAQVSSPEFTGSRFWALQAVDAEDSDLEDGVEEEGGDEDSAAGGEDRSAIYLCHTPAPVRDADLVETSSELSRRQAKRLRRRDE
jgi:hypothetical protein